LVQFITLFWCWQFPQDLHTQKLPENKRFHVEAHALVMPSPELGDEPCEIAAVQSRHHSADDAASSLNTKPSDLDKGLLGLAE
jgi:hypothetical protein